MEICLLKVWEYVFSRQMLNVCKTTYSQTNVKQAFLGKPKKGANFGKGDNFYDFYLLSYKIEPLVNIDLL